MGFVRIHLSFLVNMRYIAKISSYVLILTTGKEISVPKSRYAQVKRQYMLFRGESELKKLFIDLSPFSKGKEG